MAAANEPVARTKVLIVDDQPAVLSAVRDWLAYDTDLDIIGQAEDGITALTLAQELQPDIVLIDLKMPNMDGIATAGALREVAPQVRVVILTVYDDVASRARAQAAGVAAFVAKHDSIETLLAVIREVTASRQERL
jgi:DNA-binding NarL/FixJ family response regulator